MVNFIYLIAAIGFLLLAFGFSFATYRVAKSKEFSSKKEKAYSIMIGIICQVVFVFVAGNNFSHIDWMYMAGISDNFVSLTHAGGYQFLSLVLLALLPLVAFGYVGLILERYENVMIWFGATFASFLSGLLIVSIAKGWFLTGTIASAYLWVCASIPNYTLTVKNFFLSVDAGGFFDAFLFCAVVAILVKDRINIQMRIMTAEREIENSREMVGHLSKSLEGAVSTICNVDNKQANSVVSINDELIRLEEAVKDQREKLNRQSEVIDLCDKRLNHLEGDSRDFREFKDNLEYNNMAGQGLPTGHGIEEYYEREKYNIDNVVRKSLNANSNTVCSIIEINKESEESRKAFLDAVEKLKTGINSQYILNYCLETGQDKNQWLQEMSEFIDNEGNQYDQRLVDFMVKEGFDSINYNVKPEKLVSISKENAGFEVQVKLKGEVVFDRYIHESKMDTDNKRAIITLMPGWILDVGFPGDWTSSQTVVFKNSYHKESNYENWTTIYNLFPKRDGMSETVFDALFLDRNRGGVKFNRKSVSVKENDTVRTFQIRGNSEDGREIIANLSLHKESDNGQMFEVVNISKDHRLVFTANDKNVADGISVVCRKSIYATYTSK